MRMETEEGTYAHKMLHCTGDIFYYYRMHDASAMGSRNTTNRVKYMNAMLELAKIDCEAMLNQTKPDWYRSQYKELFEKRIYEYMMCCLPIECEDLGKRLKELKIEGLYPHKRTSFRNFRGMGEISRGKGRIKDWVRYMMFRYKLLYRVYFVLNKKKNK